MAALRIPSATYRFQFHRRFRFEHAVALVPYLEALGITDLYASPIFQARRGSTHGYDVTDPTLLNVELGGEENFDPLVKALGDRGMGILLDIVPNHMAASVENRWWTDVLESGQGSPFAGFFDIDWHSPKKALDGKVLLPILGGPYGRMIEEQELSLRLEKDGFTVHCHSAKLPVSILSYPRILSLRLSSLEETYGPDHPSFRELWDLITTMEHLPEDRGGGCGVGPRALRLRRGDQGASPAPVHGAPRDPGAHRRNLAVGERPERGSCQLRSPRPDPLRAALLALLLAARERGDQLPALLRRQRPGILAGRGSAGLRRLPRPDPAAGAGREDHRPARGPRRWAVRPPRVPRPAHAAPDGVGSADPAAGILRAGGKDPRGGGSASPGVADPRNDGIRLPERAERGLPQRPGHEDPGRDLRAVPRKSHRTSGRRSTGARSW